MPYWALDAIRDVSDMITAAQLRAARALIGLHQRRLAELAALSAVVSALPNPHHSNPAKA
jgi:hypothetical protein